jgi:phosphatidylglycerol:prolipoprotein diacylglycerol transferase
MYPIIFRIGHFAVHSWGVMLACSVFAGISLSLKRAKTRELEPEIIPDVAFILLVAGIIGARIYYVVLHLEDFEQNLSLIVNPFTGETFGFGGLVLYGGLIGAIGAGFVYLHIKKVSFLDYADVIAPSLGFGIFLTRIGCFLNGCCYGKPTKLFFGVHFPSDSAAGAFQRRVAENSCVMESEIKLLPSQLFLSAGGLIIAFLVLFIGRKKLFKGFEFYVFLMLYAVDRFLIDFLRYYAPDEKCGFFSHNQIICFVLFAVSLCLILKNIPFINLTRLLKNKK